eukprot:CAMPEP_0168471034 /NCGR_PEP_ID=MMETSP0228-20121227/59065_1 /TAXON_ID=133427 /ORGANISM="Protoceratium reticulatum, Strain CCCM 535 (=CCMP 1889)" /LENGTH=50 /DNA_ID=CAMNT_0008486913 /DNA_START=29 /DNA_END=177 /DNA_ORIENTATION=+
MSALLLGLQPAAQSSASIFACAAAILAATFALRCFNVSFMVRTCSVPSET